jgi:hypothetical protein
MAMTIPITTKTTIAICIQIQVGDIAGHSVPTTAKAFGSPAPPCAMAQATAHQAQ